MKKTLWTLLLVLVLPLSSFAEEGMWLPLLLSQLNEGEMQELGFELTAEDLYSINKSSMKDAVVRFGGGCTGEIISNRGLLLTNHHCGYGSIQSHSTVENDYLTDGFWAGNRDEEIPTPGLTATFIVRIDDVTGQVLEGVTDEMSEEEREKIILANSQKARDEATENTHYDAVVKSFFYGNQYYMFVTETFKDVRLVGAPPSSIGKFGGDTDNWMWPRHTGDFSLFRIYANKKNEPAEYSPENKPYKPKYHFPISLKGVKPNDFTLIYGFPGTTKQYIPSFEVEYVQHKANPAKINMRETSLSLMDAAMSESDKVRIQYAARYASISNYYKKWIGENTGLRRLDAIAKRKAYEKEFQVRAARDKPEAVVLLKQFEEKYEEIERFAFAREMFIELVYYGPKFINYASEFAPLAQEYEKLKGEEKLEETLEKLKTSTRQHFKNYHEPLEQELTAALLKLYFEEIDPSLHPGFVQQIAEGFEGDYSAFAAHVFSESILTNEEKATAFLEGFDEDSPGEIEKDLGFQVMGDLFNAYFGKIGPTYQQYSAGIDKLMRAYVAARMELFPEKKYWPDANSTLRIGYGVVAGSQPRDGMQYLPHSTLEGVMQKHNPGHTAVEEFYVDPKLMELYEEKDYGPYAHNGEMWVNFTASNHTTGGNSGSPVINAKGELIGINFDRSWESTMSDIIYDADRCRNITVDIRYVLFIVDKFAGADHLIKEMDLVKK